MTAPAPRLRAWIWRRAGALLCVLILAACAQSETVETPSPTAGADRSADPAWEASIRDWRDRRVQRLRSEDGWLTLVGLHWLTEGVNTVGSAPGNDIRVPGGPRAWGAVIVDGTALRFEPAAEAELTIDGAPASATALIPDDVGEPTVVRAGTVSVHVIHRESYALRVQDTQAPTRVGFTGIENFAMEPDWRIDADFVPAEPGTTIDIGDVLGHVTPHRVPGFAEFERDGRRYRLTGVAEEDADSVWFIFADRTNGRETYGGGRFLYSDGLPEGGRLTIDFNKAYNPPCVFTDYSTCPLPPQENRLDLAVRAGEKDYRGPAARP